jgi:hypothetical protein
MSGRRSYTGGFPLRPTLLHRQQPERFRLRHSPHPRETGILQAPRALRENSGRLTATAGCRLTQPEHPQDRLRYSVRYCVHPGDAQVARSPACSPSFNAAWRCSDEPCVHDSGET